MFQTNLQKKKKKPKNTSHYSVCLYVIERYRADPEPFTQHWVFLCMQEILMKSRMMECGESHLHTLYCTTSTRTMTTSLALCKSSTHASEWWHYDDKRSTGAVLLGCNVVLRVLQMYECFTYRGGKRPFLRINREALVSPNSESHIAINRWMKVTPKHCVSIQSIHTS